MTWLPLNLPIPSEVSSISTGISTGLNAVKTALEAVKVQAQILQTLAHQEDELIVTAANTAIQSVVSALTNALNALLDDTGVYLLPVPLPKKGLIRLLAAPSNPNEPGSNFLAFPANNVLAGLTEAQAAQLRQTSLWEQIFNPDELFIGGNAYYVKTLAESLFDPLDNNRPKFTRSDSWAYTLLIAGASDLPGVMTAATFFDRLFGQGQNANSLGTTRHLTNLIPNNVRVAYSSRETAAVVEWEPVIPRVTLESFDNSVLIAEKFAVIRSTDFRSKPALRVSDLFDKDLKQGDEGLFGAEVIFVGDYDGVTSRWLDTGVKPNKTYYYHVAFKCRLQPSFDVNTVRPDVNLEIQKEAEGSDKNNIDLQLRWDKLSAGIEFSIPNHPDSANPQSMGKPPDWMRTPSLARFFPPLNRFIDIVQEQLKTFAKSSQSLTKRNEQYLAFLDAEINRYERMITEVQHHLNTLNGLLSNPKAGIYVTVNSGKGNVSAFLADVSSQFSNFSDTGRPPFDAGTEFVCGIIVLTVAPDPTQLLKALSAMQALFQPSAGTDPILAGIQSVQTSLATVEQTMIDAIMGGGEDRTKMSRVFDGSMKPRPVGSSDAGCDPAEMVVPVINPDGTPKV
jgi:hypothetical protein